MINNRFTLLFVFMISTQSIFAQSDRKQASGTDPTQSPGSSQNYQLTRVELMSLPNIREFQKTPSPQFLIPWDNLRTGEPYLGVNTDRPHTGCHLYFKYPEKSLDANKPETYPPIYAIADGVITRIDYAFRLRPVFMREQGKEVSNIRYGIDLAFARSGNEPVTFHYSIEPMTDPGDEKYYEPFILAKPGSKVRRGDVMAHMFLPVDPETASSSHIHFNLIARRQFQSPSIFDKDVAQKFQATWGESHDNASRKRPPFIGFGLSAQENPFGTGAIDRL